MLIASNVAAKLVNLTSLQNRKPPLDLRGSQKWPLGLAQSEAPRNTTQDYCPLLLPLPSTRNSPRQCGRADNGLIRTAATVGEDAGPPIPPRSELIPAVMSSRAVCGVFGMASLQSRLPSWFSN